MQQFRKEMDAALESYEEALKLFRAVGDRLGEANVYAVQGKRYLFEDQHKADQFLDQPIHIFQQIGSLYSSTLSPVEVVQDPG